MRWTPQNQCGTKYDKYLCLMDNFLHIHVNKKLPEADVKLILFLTQFSSSVIYSFFLFLFLFFNRFLARFFFAPLLLLVVLLIDYWEVPLDGFNGLPEKGITVAYRSFTPATAPQVHSPILVYDRVVKSRVKYWNRLMGSRIRHRNT